MKYPQRGACLTHLDMALQVAHDELAIHHYLIMQSQQ